jgi:hypothetical protein
VPLFTLDAASIRYLGAVGAECPRILWKRSGGRRQKTLRDMATSLVYRPFQPRWFVLSDSVLVYFRSSAAREPQGVILLDQGLQAQHGFEVTARASEFIVRTLSRRMLLAGDSPLVRNARQPVGKGGGEGSWAEGEAWLQGVGLTALRCLWPLPHE